MFSPKQPIDHLIGALGFVGILSDQMRYGNKPPGWSFSKLPAATQEGLRQLRSEDTWGLQPWNYDYTPHSKPATAKVVRLK